MVTKMMVVRIMVIKDSDNKDDGNEDDCHVDDVNEDDCNVDDGGEDDVNEDWPLYTLQFEAPTTAGIQHCNCAKRRGIRPNNCTAGDSAASFWKMLARKKSLLKT